MVDLRDRLDDRRQATARSSTSIFASLRRLWGPAQARYERGQPVLRAMLGWQLIAGFIIAILLSIWWSWTNQ